MEKKFANIDKQNEFKVDTSRISPDINVEEFLKSLKELQVPCPWGDLSIGEGMEEALPGIPDSKLIPRIPLALSLGCGQFPDINAYRSIVRADEFGKIVYTDIKYPQIVTADDDYISLDLTKPKSINLFGFKVQAIMSISVFTYDGHGVEFLDKQNEMAAAQALNEMLMPGGIIASDSLGSSRFEQIFIKKFGYKQIRNANSIILQKPF